jgi:hypothetical protein
MPSVLHLVSPRAIDISKSLGASPLRTSACAGWLHTTFGRYMVEEPFIKGLRCACAKGKIS